MQEIIGNIHKCMHAYNKWDFANLFKKMYVMEGYIQRRILDVISISEAILLIDDSKFVVFGGM